MAVESERSGGMSDPFATDKAEMAKGRIRDRIVGLIRVPARDLVPNPKNWRRHPKAQRDALRDLFDEIGYADVLLVRKMPDGRLMLIDGHLRSEMTPDEVVPVLVLDVTEQEADKLLLTLDPLASLAERDSKRTTELLTTVQTNSASVKELLQRVAGNQIWSFLYPDEIREAQVSPNRANELKTKWRTARGQIWQADDHRLLCGDSTKVDEVARLWQTGRRFRSVWTDPVYGVDYAAKNEFLSALDRGNRVQTPITNDNRPEKAPEVFEAALRVATAHAEPGASCYATLPGGPLLPRFIAAFNNSGFSFKTTLVWVKQQFVLGRSDYNFAHEPIAYGWIENGPHYFTDDRSQSSVFAVNKPHASTMHPTMKPVELIVPMIRNSTRPGEIVYDPFAGSGSTALAAHQLGRVAYACEIEPGYLAVELERLSLLGLKPELVNK